jgi:CBS domain-containing protein
MKVRDVMTADPACCTPDTSLREVARLMLEHDCGEIPVADSMDSKKPQGVVTDRDIVCRTVAQGRNPLELSARDAMTSPAVTVTPDTDLDDCANLMETKQIRRVPVVDAQGRCVGIVAQADIVRRAHDRMAAELVREVSEQPKGQPQNR